MINKQEEVESNVRLALGDMTLQIIALRAENAELRSQLEAKPEEQPVPATNRVNGRPGKEATQ